MKKWFILALLLLTPLVHAKKVAPMPDLVNPDSITLGNNQIYIAEGTSIYIYGSKDFKLIKKIGKEGEGPREFKLSVDAGVEELIIDAKTENLIVTSLGKISFYKKDGTYISERKCVDRSREFKALGKGFAGQGNLTNDGKGNRFRAINIYDSQLNKVKEVFKVRHHFHLQEGLRLLETAKTFDTYGDRLFIAWERDFIIRVFDANGNHLFNITRDFEKVEVTDVHKQQLTNFFKTSPRYRRIFEMLQIKLIFPDSFAAVLDFRVTDGKVYAITFKKDRAGFETFIYDVNGKFLRKVSLPMNQTETFAPQPYGIKNGIFYQLMENDEEEWELHVSEF
jgi:hypothetical protein